MPVESQLGRHYSQYVRLFQWLGLSLFFHLTLVTFVGGASQRLPHRPLTVDIQHIPAETADPLTSPVIAPEAVPDLAVDNPLPQAHNPKEEVARPSVLPKPDTELAVPLESYLDVNAVDVGAEPANDVVLSYPIAAYVRRTAGVVRLNLFINEQGRLDRIDLIDATPKGIFEKDAIETVSKLYFHPATRHGRPVKSRKTIEVVFDPNPELDQAKSNPVTPKTSATEK